MSLPEDEMTLLTSIKSRGYWFVTIRPAIYQDSLISSRELTDIVASSQVRARGWSLPIIDPTIGLRNGDNYVGSRVDWKYHREIWHLYQSGQFAHVKGIWVDWYDHNPDDLRAQGVDWRPGARLNILDTISTVGEYYLLAGRLLDALPVDRLFIRYQVFGLSGRELAIEDPARGHFHEQRVTDAARFDSRDLEITAEQFLAGRWEFAIGVLGELFGKFGWRPEKLMLNGYLEAQLAGHW